MAVTDREHPIIAARKTKLNLNRLAYYGGESYVHSRLWRAPNESQLSWDGRSAGQNYGGEWTTGRRDRAVCAQDGRRIADKIQQYLFSVAPKRDGVDEAWAATAGAGGESLDEVWQSVSLAVTLCGWCWVAVQMPVIPEGYSLARVMAEGLHPTLSVLYPWEVPDWHFGAHNELTWAITESTVRDDSDPLTDAKDVKTRMLWQQTDKGLQWTEYRDGKPVKEGVQPHGAPIPLVLVGRPSFAPWWYDTVESMQALLTNLDSLHSENLARTVYPQLIISAGTFANLEQRLVEMPAQDAGQRVIKIVKELTRSADAPIVESPEESGITRYIQPNASDLAAIPDAVKMHRSALFESVGLSLFNREQRTIQTAESKAFDHLDTNATLRQRAQMMEDAEREVVAMTAAAFPGFRSYEPAWNKDFDIADTEADAKALLQVGNIPDLTLTQRKLVLRAATTVLQGITSVSDEDEKAIQEEIDALKDIDTTNGLPAPVIG